ncbi:MAG: hypothetical protein DMD81_13250 [Candidatus Rokuibacteriota bacterium]|nr:MAG: hypothetical protein DMD81_13250 [Candidatus Rokubacteria bacterium]
MFAGSTASERSDTGTGSTKASRRGSHSNEGRSDGPGPVSRRAIRPLRHAGRLRSRTAPARPDRTATGAVDGGAAPRRLEIARTDRDARRLLRGAQRELARGSSSIANGSRSSRSDRDACPGDLVDTLIETHRRELSKAVEFPPHHGPLLRRLAERHRLAVVSNFDYTPTAIGILKQAGVADLFEAIVVSAEVGWRKPRREIFDVALTELGVRPAEALFVGDRADIDVVGAQDIGMPVAWINRAAEPLPDGIALPSYEIRDLAELEKILDPAMRASSRSVPASQEGERSDRRHDRPS